VPEDEAHPLTHPPLQLPEHGVGLSAIGTFVVAVHHQIHRRVLRPARMVSSSDRLETILEALDAGAADGDEWAAYGCAVIPSRQPHAMDASAVAPSGLSSA